MTSPLYWDERRDLIIPGSQAETIAFCTAHLLNIAIKSIRETGSFKIALSGGSTPKAIFTDIPGHPLAAQVDWQKVWLFWGDERSVPTSDPDNNYRMAMQSGLDKLNIPENQIFRMQAEENIEQNAEIYDQAIQKLVPNGFDFMMLGMGDDGHTASLFPHTEALHITERLAVANFIPQKNTWRMTVTFPCINAAKHIAIYVLGQNKAEMVKTALSETFQPDKYPIQNVGRSTHKALWICDKDAASQLK